MLKKIAAVLILIGLCTPYSCNVRPIGTLIPRSQDEIGGLFFYGIPTLAGLAYVAWVFFPGVRAWVRRREAPLRKVLLGLFLLLALGFVAVEADDLRTRTQIDVENWASLALALLWGGGIIAWTRRWGKDADSVPPLLLAVLGIPLIRFFWPPSGRQYGAWILASGYVLAVLTEARAPCRAPDAPDG
jgi:hypothetical protein